MQAARPYVLAGAVLAAASVVAVTPTVSRPSQLPIRSIETRLVDDSILNVPINLFEDILNVPYNEIQGMDGFGASEFFTGSWWVPGSTNIWGIDPGDTTHTVALDGLIAPFPSLLNGVGGLNYENDGLLAAELPASISCAAESCAPITPPNVITGLTSLDRDIGFLQSLNPNSGFGLFADWFKVPLSTLMSGNYQFGTVTDPSGVAYSGFGFGNNSVDGTNPFEGGTTGADNLMPWSGMDFKYDPLQPLENFWTSLTAPVSSGPGVEIPSLFGAEGLFQGLQNMLAGAVVDFDPFVEGSPACPGACTDALSVDSILKFLNPGGNDSMINEWLTAFANGTVNGPTQNQTFDSIALLQTGLFNLTPDQLGTPDTTGVLADWAAINPELPQLLVNAGIYTDPSYLTWIGGSQIDPLCTDGSCGLLGGLNPMAVFPDLLKLLGSPTNYGELFNFQNWMAILDPASVAPDVSGAAASAVDPAGLLGGIDSTGVAADLANLFGNFGANLAPDLASIFTNVF